MARWGCEICGYIYDEALGDSEHDIPVGISFEDLPEEWVCPDCGADKESFVDGEE